MEKRNFTHNKKIDIENSKNWIFPKGCVHGFGEEIEISMFLFWAKEQRKCIEEIRYSKERFSRQW